MMVSFVLSFFPRDVLDEILNLIESVSEDFPSYSSIGAYRMGRLRCPSAVVRLHIQMAFPLEPLSQLLPNFICSLLKLRERKIVQMVWVT